jgi:quinol monooxygenase YgiN
MIAISTAKKYFEILISLMILSTLIGCTQNDNKSSEITKMSDAQISLAVIIEAKEGNEEAVKEACIGLLEPTRKEKGCINYTLHIDPKDESRFMFYENWENIELWEAHLKTAHIKEFGTKTKGMLANQLDVTNWVIYE